MNHKLSLWESAATGWFHETQQCPLGGETRTASSCPLFAPASHDTDSTVNSTRLLLNSRTQKARGRELERVRGRESILFVCNESFLMPCKGVFGCVVPVILSVFSHVGHADAQRIFIHKKMNTVSGNSGHDYHTVQIELLL